MRACVALVAVACNAGPGQAPRLTGVVPAAVCAAGGDVVTVVGEGFGAMVADALGTPRFVAPRARLGGVEAAVRFRGAGALEVTVPAGVARGVVDVTVENPGGQAATLAAGLALVDGPTLAGVEGERLCGGRSVTVRGAGLEPAPRVSVDGIDVGAVTASGCATGRCTALEITLPPQLAPGAHTLSVENPAESACPGVAELAVELAGGPEIVSVEPDRCEAPTLLTVRGANFAAGVAVALDGAARAVERVDAATLRVTLAGGDLAAPATLGVLNPDGCVALAGLAAAGQAAQPIAVAPRVAWSGGATRIVVTLAGGPAAGTPSRVLLRGPGDDGAEVRLDDVAAVPGRPGEVAATVPPGLDAGAYDVIVGNPGCTAALAGGLRVVDERGLALTRLLPAFAQAGRETEARVEAEAPGFDDVPALYAGGVPLRAVALAAPTAATAIVPPLAAGSYDIVAVTPGGAVGVLPGALRVSATAPPRVDAVSPATLIAARETPLTITGEGFAADAVVTLRCGGDPLVLPVVARSGEELRATAPATLAPGLLCALRVTNDPPDGAWAELGGLVARLASENLDPFVAAPPLGTARRGPAALAVRVTREARFVLVAGGDGGARSSARNTVESAPLGPDGELGAFTTQRATLATARTFAGAAQVGAHVFVAGGADGGGALDSIERARVLDPRDAPELDHVALAPGDGPGAGSFVYRVAGLVPGDGETLPSEPIAVTAPAGQTVTLRWRRLAGATGYRVYRGPAGGGAPRLLAELGDVLAHDDDGSVTPAGDRPLEQGALGAWQTLATRLARPRQAHGVAAARDPDGRAYLYVLGGAGGDLQAPYDDYELAPVSAGTVGSFGSRVLPGGGRVFVGAAVADAAVAPEIGGATAYVYVAGGGTVTRLEPLVVTAADAAAAGRVGTGGELVFVDVRPPRVAGAPLAAAAGSLFAFGGWPVTNNVNGSAICPRSGCDGSPPELAGWSSSGGGRLSVPRAFAGVAVERGFLYVVGGVGSGGPLASTERTRW